MDPTQFSQVIAEVDALTAAVNDPWVMISAVATVIAAIASGVAAFFSYRAATETRNREALPIIVPEGEGGLNADNSHQLRLWLRNIGQGIAKETTVYIENILVEGNWPSITGNSNGSMMLIPAEDKVAVLTPLLQTGKRVITMRIDYRDINNKLHSTLTRLNLENDTYVMDRGWWRLN